MKLLIKISTLIMIIGCILPLYPGSNVVFANGNTAENRPLFTIAGYHPALSPEQNTVFVGKGRLETSLPFRILDGKKLKTTATDLAGNQSKATITSIPAKIGWVKWIGQWYYFNSNGTRATGWIKYHNNWYYLNYAGVMQTSWLKSGNDWYYLDKSSGSMKTGWVKISSKWYYFYSSGKMAHDTKVGKYRLGHSGSRL